MRAFAVTDFDQPGSVMELPDPVPGDGELLVHIRAASEGRIKAPEITLISLDETAAALAEAGQKHGVGKTVIQIA